MIIGPCGIVCTICRYYHRGLCEGCSRGDRCPPAKALHSPCPILRCAAARKIPYCNRDCSKFPCALFEHHLPRCWSQMAASQPDQTPLDSEIFVKSPMSEPTLILQKPVDEGLRVFCLGQFRVYRGLTEIRDYEWGQGKGPTRKIKAMFAYLLGRKERGARKATLIDLLWPDRADQDRTNAVFHLALHCLRRALEPELRSMTNSSYIRYKHGRYYFKPLKPYWLDVEAFEFYCRRAEECDQDGYANSAMLYRDSALEVYGGDYMAGITRVYTENPYHDWCSSYRQYLQELYRKVVQGMTNYYYNNGEYELCLECTHKVLEQRPYHEAVHHQAMQCLTQCGQLGRS